MNKEWIAIFAIAVVVLGVGLYLVTNKKPTGNYSEFAKCLSEKGVAMYGASWCGHCQNQKKMFGDSFQYVTYVECTENQDLCSQKGVTGYPTWIIDGKQYPGEQSFQKLSELSGCASPS